MHVQRHHGCLNFGNAACAVEKVILFNPVDALRSPKVKIRGQHSGNIGGITALQRRAKTYFDQHGMVCVSCRTEHCIVRCMARFRAVTVDPGQQLLRILSGPHRPQRGIRRAQSIHRSPTR